MAPSLSSRPASNVESRELTPLAPLMQSYQTARAAALEEARTLTGASLRDRLQQFRVQEQLEAPDASEVTQEREEILQILAYAHPSVEQPRRELVGRIVAEVRRAPLDKRQQIAQGLFDQLEAQNLVDPALLGELLLAGFQLGSDDMIDIVKTADAQLVSMGKDAILDYRGTERNPNRPYPQDIAFGAYFAQNLLQGNRNLLVQALVTSKNSTDFAAATAQHYQEYLTSKGLSSTDYFVSRDFYTRLCDRFGITRRLNSIDIDRYLDQNSVAQMEQLFQEDIKRAQTNRNEALRRGDREQGLRHDRRADATEALQRINREVVVAAGVLPNVARSINVDTRHLQGTVSRFVGIPLEWANSGINKLTEWTPRLPRFADTGPLSLGLGVGAATAVAIGGISLAMPFFTHGTTAVLHPFSAWQETKGLASDLWTQAPSIAGTMALSGAFLVSSNPQGAAEWAGRRWDEIKALGQRAGSTEVAAGASRLIRRGYESLIEGRFDGTKEAFENVWNWLKQQPSYLLGLSSEAWDRVTIKARELGMNVDNYRERYTALGNLRSEVNRSLRGAGLENLSGWTSGISEEKFNTFLQRFLAQNQTKDLSDGGTDDATVQLSDLLTAGFYSQADYDRIPQNQRTQSISDGLARRLMQLARRQNQ